MTAPIDDSMKALLSFLKKLTLTPNEVNSADISELMEMGLSKQAIEDAIQVCVLFNIIDRIADTMEFHVPSDETFAKMAGPMLKMGYRL